MQIVQLHCIYVVTATTSALYKSVLRYTKSKMHHFCWK